MAQYLMQGPHAADAVRVGPLDKPAVFYSPSEKSWLLAEDFQREIEGVTWFIGAGFKFDLSSVPRFLWPVIAPNELGVLPPLCHDWLYRHGGEAPVLTEHKVIYTRAGADGLFERLIKAEGGVPAWRRKAAYAAVRLFGHGSWRG